MYFSAPFHIRRQSAGDQLWIEHRTLRTFLKYVHWKIIKSKPIVDYDSAYPPDWHPISAYAVVSRALPRRVVLAVVAPVALDRVVHARLRVRVGRRRNMIYDIAQIKYNLGPNLYYVTQPCEAFLTARSSSELALIC